MADFDEKSLWNNSDSNINSCTSGGMSDQLRSLDITRSSSNSYTSAKSSEFATVNFTTQSYTHSHHSESSPYSLRQSQLSIPYQYDVLLLYDPDDSTRYLDELMQYLAPQQLNIFDFNRDTPAGLPPQKVLQSTFKMCRYTCIMITERFLNNFWLQFRTDMSIQDMLDNQQKLYSVIVVVMDANVKRFDLPLDLMTLSPLFITDRYFKNRISKAFSKSVPFPMAVHTSGDFSKQPLPLSHLPPSYSDVTKPESFLNVNLDRKDGSDYHSHEYGRDQTVPTCITNIKEINYRSTVDVSISPSSGPSSRLPREHSDNTYLMPQSLFLSSTDTAAMISAARSIQRESSVTVGSTGSRTPKEILETSVVGGSDSKTLLPNLSSELGSSSSEEHSSGRTTESSNGHNQYVEEDFSFLNRSVDFNADHGVQNIKRDIDSPGFFSLSTVNSVRSSMSEYSELEISQLSKPCQSDTKCSDSPRNADRAFPQTHPEHSMDNGSYRSLPFPRGVLNEPGIPRCSSLGQEHANARHGRKLSRSKVDASCVSLPECSRSEASHINAAKRSFSVRSLFGLRRKPKKGDVSEGKRK